MSDFTPLVTSLDAAMVVFYQHGLLDATSQQLAKALHTNTSDLTAQFPDRATLVHQAMLANIERQKHDHAKLYVQYASAVERLYGLLKLGLQELALVPAPFYGELQANFPKAWDAVMEHFASYSAPQLQQLLNDGICSKLFRSDINIQLVTKILIEQLNLMLNPQIFPPDRFSTGEVFRSIFLYYIRGICTDEGARIAAEHFARL